MCGFTSCLSSTARLPCVMVSRDDIRHTHRAIHTLIYTLARTCCFTRFCDFALFQTVSLGARAGELMRGLSSPQRVFIRGAGGNKVMLLSFRSCDWCVHVRAQQLPLLCSKFHFCLLSLACLLQLQHSPSRPFCCTTIAINLLLDPISLR